MAASRIGSAGTNMTTKSSEPDYGVVVAPAAECPGMTQERTGV